MAINYVKLVGVDALDAPVEVLWAFNDAGAMLTDGEQTGQRNLIDPNADGYQYKGIASPGEATSSATWQIRRWNLDGWPIDVQWADGNSLSDNVWESRDTAWACRRFPRFRFSTR
jgi:hypothetical protein